jgi:hypothetical protein
MEPKKRQPLVIIALTAGSNFSLVAWLAALAANCRDYAGTGLALAVADTLNASSKT